MLQSSEHQNDQTQKQFISPSNQSHEHFTLNGEHATLLCNYLFTTHTLSFQICTCQTSHIIVCIVNCVFAILYNICNISNLFVYCYFVFCVLSCCCHSVALWSFCHYNKFLICVNIPGNKAHSDIILLLFVSCPVAVILLHVCVNIPGQ